MKGGDKPYRIFFLLLFLSTFLCITSCQKEEITDLTSSSISSQIRAKITYFHKDKALVKINHLRNLILNHKTTMKTVGDSIGFSWGYIDDNRVMQLKLVNDSTQEETVNTTFKMIRNDGKGKHKAFINLVLSENKYRTTLTLYGYVMAPQFATNYLYEGAPITDFNGVVLTQTVFEEDHLQEINGNCKNQVRIIENWNKGHKSPGGGGQYSGTGAGSGGSAGSSFVYNLDNIIYHMYNPGGQPTTPCDNCSGSPIDIGGVLEFIGGFFSGIGSSIGDTWHSIRRWVRSFQGCVCPSGRPKLDNNLTLNGQGMILIDYEGFDSNNPNNLINPYPDGSYFSNAPCHNLAVGILSDLYSRTFMAWSLSVREDDDLHAGGPNYIKEVTIDDVNWLFNHTDFFIPGIEFLEQEDFSDEAKLYFWQQLQAARYNGQYSDNINYQAVFLNFWLGLDEDSDEFEWLTTQAPLDQVQQMYDFISDSDRTSPDVDILHSLIDFLRDESQPTIDVENYLNLLTNLKADSNYLLKHFSLDPGDGDYDDWKDLAQYAEHLPQAVIDKIETLNASNNPDYNWSIQDIKDATGANVNMDLFPVKMTQLPNKPFWYDNNGGQFTAEEFLNFVRTNINMFTKDENGNELSHFEGINTNEEILWNSNNPLTAVLHIDIPINDGSVICSKYNDTEWYFTTLTAPFPVDEDGTHPVSGNRAFGITTNSDGSYSIFTRGVDRVKYRLAEIIGNYIWDSAFQLADNLWTAFQNNLVDFIQDNGGQATKVQVEPKRVDWEAVQDYLYGN